MISNDFLIDNICQTIRSLLLFLMIVIFLPACGETNVTPTVQESGSVQVVRNVFERISEQSIANIHFSLMEDDELDWYQVDAKNGQLIISANAPTALSYGAYQYLRSIGAMSVSWEGSRVALPDMFTDYTGEKVTSLFKQRAYLNVCAYGYTMPWWDWIRWEKELDWMAVHGINNPVAMEGQEYIWQKLWNEFGVDNTELSGYFSGPAFTPWQRMGNIEGHKGPLPQAWINKKHKLQKKIITRMKRLGMQPVVPAFGGYVPKEFIELFPKAKISAMPKWTGFSQETYWLDPADPLFSQIAKRFIALYNQEYGAQTYYLSDSFNEMLPPVSEENRYEALAQYGEKIYQSIQQAAPDATWVMQGWMFGADEEFWDLASIEAFLSKVPNDKVMIHDIGNDRYHVWQKANGFFSKPWVFGFIHNYGGSDPIYGDFDNYSQQVRQLLSASNAGSVTGFGVFPEGINNNSVVYEYLFDLPWTGGMQKKSDWIQDYLKARYGQASTTLIQAWATLNKAVYSTKYWTSRWWENSAGAYLLFKRPSIELIRFESHPTDLAGLDKAIEEMLTVSSDQLSSFFIYDLVDLTKHSVSLHVDKLLQQALQAYQQKNIAKGDALATKVTSLVTQLDQLIGIHQESLTSWLDDASAYADNEKLSQYYVNNAKQQITVWGGPKLKDYASKAWQGMYANFYLPRWHLYLQALKESAITGKAMNEEMIQTKLVEWEKQWVAEYKPDSTHIPKQPIKLVQALMQQTKSK